MTCFVSGARKLVPYCASKFAVRGLTEAFGEWRIARTLSSDYRLSNDTFASP